MLRDLDNATDIVETVDTLLRSADVNERLPTPVDDIVAAAELIEADDYVLSESKIREAPKALRRFLQSARNKIRGVLDRREKVIHVSDSVTNDARRDFIRLHETFHHAARWQRELLFGDTDITLAPSIDLRFEREANQGAAELFFQRTLFERVARDYPVDISTPAELHALFGPSFHATFRRWIETHEHALMGVALDPQPLSTAPVRFRRYELIESTKWRRQFGHTRLPRRVVSERNLPFLVEIAASPVDVTDLGELAWADVNGRRRDLRVQSLGTPYRTFVLMWLPQRERTVARLRRKADVVVDRG